MGWWHCIGVRKDRLGRCYDECRMLAQTLNAIAALFFQFLEMNGDFPCVCLCLPRIRIREMRNAY